MYPKMLFRYRR